MPSHAKEQQPESSTVAPSLLSETLTLASSQLQAIYNRLPSAAQGQITSAFESLQALLPHQKPPAGTSSSLQEQISSFPASNSYIALTFAVLGPFLILLFSMSSWWPSSGRYSPFAAYTARGPPKVTQDDFTYLSGSNDDRHHHHDSHHNHTQPAHGRNDNYGFPSRGHTQSRADAMKDLDLDPDILVLKHKGTTYPLHFPAFSIAESLKVGELRRQAAKETKCDDPHRVKLLYKGRSLRDDSKQCREEGLKQNSELMCVVSEEPAPRGNDGSESSDSASSAAMANGVDAIPRESRTKRKGHRGGGKRKGGNNKTTRFDDSPRDSGRDASFLSPPNGVSSTDRSPSRDRPAIPSAAATPPLKKPTTPLEILDAVSSDFNNNFLPKVHHLLEHPPKDEKTRDYESKKLSEGILTQVLFKLDGVQTEDETIKARRKECVKEANFWSGKLDRLQKK